VAINNPSDGLPNGNGSYGNGDGGEFAALPRRRSSMSRPVTLEARPELRDRETYYSDLRYAVHCQSRNILGAGTWKPDTWT
jgi:hypothetical protein